MQLKRIKSSFSAKWNEYPLHFLTLRCTMNLMGPAALGPLCRHLLLVHQPQASVSAPAQLESTCQRLAVPKSLLLVVSGFHEVALFPWNSSTCKCAEEWVCRDSEPYGQAKGQHMVGDGSVLIHRIFQLSLRRRQWWGQGSVFWIALSFRWQMRLLVTASMLKLVLVFLIMVWVECREISVYTCTCGQWEVHC